MSRWPGRLISKTPVTPGGAAPTAAAPGVWTLAEQAYWQKQGLWPDASADAYWGYVSFLMSTSSLSNANNNLFVDSSGAFNPISRTGTPTQGAQTPYGTFWSNYFNGSSYVYAASGTAQGTGDFTVEGWFNISSYSTGPGLYDTRPNTTNGAYVAVFVNTSGNLIYYVNTADQITGSTTITLNTWNHFAVCRSGTSTRLFLNGVQQGSTYTDTNNYQMGGSRPIIGGNGYAPGAASTLTGYISNIRAVNGTALYTSNFTPPAAPLTAISGTTLLTCQSNRFKDSSGNNVAITASGAPSVTAFSPFVLAAPGAVYNQNDVSYWSAYFDGSGDYLRSSLDGVNIRTAFTIEGWVNLGTASNFIFFSGSPTAGAAGQALYLNESSGTVYFGDGVSNNITFSSSLLPVNSWGHIACTFDGTTYRIFINGTSVGSSTTLLQNYTLNGIDIGGRTAGATVYMTGYTSNFRVVKGSALYTSNFTPPTTPLTAISGTSLLTCQNAAFTDNSSNNYAVTAAGNTTVSGANPFQAGYYSMGNITNAQDTGIGVVTNTAFNLGTGDFTVECWVNLFALPTSNTWTTSAGGYQAIFSTGPSNSATGSQLYIGTTNILFDVVSDGSGPINVAHGMSPGVWYHIALSRSGNTFRLFKNGVLLQSGTDSNSMPTGYGWGVGRGEPVGSWNGGWVYGYLSNFRLVKGTALYTAAFTPPTSPLTAVSGTSLLTCQSGRFIDNSGNNFTISLGSTTPTTVQTYNPLYSATPASNGGSMYFDGSGDYVTTTSQAFAFGTGAWTVDFWVYPLAYGGSVVGGQMFGTVNGSTSGYSIAMGQDINSFRLISNASGTWADNLSVGTGNGPPLNAWSHMAVVRSGANISIFRNGTRVATTASATSWSFSGTTGVIGRFNDGPNVRDFNGYISNLRVSGSAIFDPTASSITIPTAPTAPTANTALLINGTNGGVYDASTKNDLTTVGSAQASAAQAKYGTTAAYFPAASSYLNAPFSQNAVFNTGDFTVEAWVYSVATTAGYTCILSSRDGIASNANAVFFGLKPTTNQLTFYTSGEIIGTSTAVSTGTWTHVALVRSSGTATIYINGTSAGTASFTTSLTGTGLSVGNEYNGASSNGGLYVDDLRITKGVARYTSNFTPPAAALPVY